VKGVAWSQSGKVLCGKMFSQIKDLPAVDAVPVVHGEWKWSHGGECSECGFHNSNFDYRYCPMCGAKMDGERRDET
jgi:hypothetical protein